MMFVVRLGQQSRKQQHLIFLYPPRPMFEEDVPSVLELEMEELDQWIQQDGRCQSYKKKNTLTAIFFSSFNKLYLLIASVRKVNISTIAACPPPGLQMPLFLQWPKNRQTDLSRITTLLV